MKNKLKKSIKFGILIFGISLSLINCQKDENIDEFKEHQVTKINYLDIEKLPEIASALSSISNTTSKFNKNASSKTMNTDFGQLNLTNILEYVNNDGTFTYSFLIEKEISIESPYTFENLHLVKVQDGYLGYILKWEPNDEWYENNNFTFLIQNFTGKQTHFDLDYNILQETEFINGQQIDNIRNNKIASTTNAIRDYYLECTTEIVSLCSYGGSDNCQGSVCGYGAIQVCFLSGGSGSGNGGSGTTGEEDSTNLSGGGTRIPRNDNTTEIVDDGSATVVPAIPVWKSFDFIIDLFNITDPETLGFLNYNTDFTDGLYSFLKKEYFSQEAIKFGEIAIGTLQNGDEVDFPFGVFKDTTFENSQLDCIYEKLKRHPFEQNTFFDDMLETFDVINSPLTFSIGNTPVAGATAFTKGEIINPNGQSITTFEIISSTGAESASNLDKMVTLSHELMHVFMYKSMEEYGLINFNSIGEPEVTNSSTLCANATIVPNINLNTLTVKERWTYLLCEIYIMNNNSFPFQWTHSLFESPVFVLETYREKLEQLLIEKHNWDYEPESTKNDMILKFGSSWKQKVAEYMSWSGLEDTPEFTTWASTQTSFIPSTFSEDPGLPNLTKEEEFCISITSYWTNLNYIEYVLNNCN